MWILGRGEFHEITFTICVRIGVISSVSTVRHGVEVLLPPCLKWSPHHVESEVLTRSLRAVTCGDIDGGGADLVHGWGRSESKIRRSPIESERGRRQQGGITRSGSDLQGALSEVVFCEEKTGRHAGIDRYVLVRESTHRRSTGNGGQTNIVQKEMIGRGTRIFAGYGKAELPVSSGVKRSSAEIEFGRFRIRGVGVLIYLYP